MLWVSRDAVDYRRVVEACLLKKVAAAEIE